jgi:dUTP pyrophosphatase
MILEYARMRDSAKPPARSNPSDAGLDVFFNPQSGESVTIEPGASVVLETGYRFGVPHGYMLEVKNRSGLASKRSLVVGACVIDAGYDGEVLINLHNIGNETQVVESGTKIAQIVMVPVVHFRALETHGGDLYNWYPIAMTERGDDGFGSTGT